MASIKFLGAAGGNVTGSSYQLTSSGGIPILIDMGMFQGTEEVDKLNYEPYEASVGRLAGMILTHAHLDHCGRIPMLFRLGFKGEIYMTEATRRLAEVVLFDSAKIARMERARKPLYTERDVGMALKRMRTVEYGARFEIGEFSAVLRNAGHILGSASIEMEEMKTGMKIAFSGDLGRSPQEIERPTELTRKADFVIMESTYGGKTHPTESASEIIKEEFNAIEESGGVLLIPAFSIERTQVLLHYIDHLKKSGEVKNETPVYLDSPMGIAATAIYEDFPELYSDELSKHASQDKPFGFPGLVITKGGRESREILRNNGAKVIIAGSGMMNGGRIVRHAREYLGHKNNRLLVVGYQAVETLGRKISEGERLVEIEGQMIEIRAHVREVASMSAHADQPRLMNWLGHIEGVEKVFLTHGEDGPREALRERIKSDLGISEVVLPLMTQEFGI